MRESTLHPHLRDEAGRRPLVFSASAHVVLLAAVTLGSTLCQPGLELEAGDGSLSGLGAAIPVALSGELTGGAGNVAPALTPAPQAVAPRRKPDPAPEKAVELPRFEDPRKDQREEATDAAASPPARSSQEPAPGTIPAEPRPGIGGAAGGGGAPGSGLRIGSGRGGPAVASWYVRQLEQRIARSWLQSALGRVSDRVLTRISFSIAAGGQIEEIRTLQSSGIGSVDRAALRAIRASSPLPPLPVELRGRRVEFVADFEYPPR